jgi:hypothetical protein
MFDKKNLLDDSALSNITGGADNQGIDGAATHTIQIPCPSEKCQNTKQIYDCYSGRRAVCRRCGRTIDI